MQIEKKGSGPWPVVTVDGVAVTLTLGEESRSYDCAELQGDAQVVVDVVRGADGGLAEGVENGGEYVACLFIPPAQYEDVPLPMPFSAEDLPEDIDPACITPAPTTERGRVPLGPEDMEAVRLILWTINTNNEEG